MASTSTVGKTTSVPPAQLNLFHKNPRKGDVPAIMSSLRRHTQYKPITANVGTHTGRPAEVLAGNHTLMAFRELAAAEPNDKRWQKMLVHWVDVDDDMAERIVVADNQTGRLGGFDEAQLAELVAGFDGDVEGLGFTDADVEALLALNGHDVLAEDDVELNGDPDDIPEPPAEPTRTSLGQRWALGDHLLLVGDSADTELVRTALDGRMPDMIWTDPPYGVEYTGKTKDALTIRNDGAEGLTKLIEGMTTTALAVARPGAPMYVAAPPGPQFGDFAIGLTAGGFQWRQTLVWVKNAMVLGRSDYHCRHEAIFYGFVPAPAGNGRLGRGGDRWFGDNAATTVLEHNKPEANAEHPTMKPVGLVSECLGNSCPPGGLVLDLFGGSGTTLIAAHMTRRRAVLVELDPIYAEVILTRFTKATGIEPVLLD